MKPLIFIISYYVILRYELVLINGFCMNVSNSQTYILLIGNLLLALMLTELITKDEQ